ncbi:hypothetical protein K9M79_04680 [Candidatus Woesearchaeota archaeon]|nr:hypothetical protein [Candidatus Woesearchaeota archaeon]
MRPKWMLTHPNGSLMITEAIRGLNPQQFESIVIISLKAFEDEYHFSEEMIREISEEFGIDKSKIIMTLLEDETRNQPETVYEGLKNAGMLDEARSEEGILLKDCDNYFKVEYSNDFENNFVVVGDLHKMDLVNAGNKSYIRVGENNTVSNIVEKKVIGNLFCCGAYYFANLGEFIQCYESLAENDNLFVSHIIYKMILDQKLFFIEESGGYLDWGTVDDWMRYKSKYATLFIDIDGVLVINSGEHFEPKWGTTEAIAENVKIINELYDSGFVTVVLTTSRKSKYKDVTEEQFKKNGIKYHSIIMDLPHCSRVLINDYTTSNPYKSAIAVNIERNSTNLRGMLDFIRRD